MARTQAITTGCIGIAATAVVGCVLPNEPFDPAAEPNLSPTIDLATVDPSVGVQPIDVDLCCSVSFEFIARDPDSTDLNFRWVKRDEATTTWLADDETLEEDLVPNGIIAQGRFNVRDNFQTQISAVRTGSGNRTAIITVYVTDAPRWKLADADQVNQGQINDARPQVYPVDFNLAQLPSRSETGGIVYSVVSHSWALEFRSGQMGCEQDACSGP